MVKKTYTTFDIAKMLDVYPTTVAKWVDEGKLEAFTTVGGHRRVNRENVLKLLTKYNVPIPSELTNDKNGSQPRILIVDDDPKILKSLSRFLKQKNKNFILQTATDGFIAGQSVLEFKPNLVILDIMLPGIDGFKICKVIKKQNKKIKIIAITGFPSEDVRKKVLKAGANAYFRKPLDINELYKKVQYYLKKAYGRGDNESFGQSGKNSG